MKKYLSLITVSMSVVAIVLFITQIILTNILATSGKKAQIIENQISAITLENEQLKSQIAAASSLMTIEEKAKNLGFTRKPAYVTIGQEVFAFSK